MTGKQLTAEERETIAINMMDDTYGENDGVRWDGGVSIVRTGADRALYTIKKDEDIVTTIATDQVALSHKLRLFLNHIAAAEESADPPDENLTGFQ